MSPAPPLAATRRFLFGIAVGDEALLLRDQERVALAADTNAIDRAPQLLERDLTHHPRRFPAAGHHPDGNRRARQAVLVELERRDVDAVGADVGGFGNRQRGVADAACGNDPPACAEERDLAKLREIENVVLEDPRLLPVLHVDAAKRESERLQDARVVVEVLGDALGDLLGDAQVPAADGLLCAGAAGRQSTRRRRRRAVRSPRSR